MKRSLFLLALMLPLMAFAQWRVGVSVGAERNHFTADKQYMTDYQYNDRWGVSAGVAGQYDFNSWLGVRAELDWTQRNHQLTRSTYSTQRYNCVNNYLLLPLMASFSFGGERLRGFCNAGVYGGYWLSSRRSGTDYNAFSGRVYDFTEKLSFDRDRDQRWDFGLVGGLGVEYRFASHWAAQVEARYYYSTTSVRKDQPYFKDKRYNSTLGLQAAVFYCF